LDGDEALALMRQGEGQRSEFKTSFAEQNDAIESLCAFANADGGTVFFGVTHDSTIQGVSIGKNTLENFANEITQHTNPPLHPLVEHVLVDGREIVIAAVPRAHKGMVFFAFGRALIRVGRTNQRISPEEIRARLQTNHFDWSMERDRPRFDVIQKAVTRHETSFQPQFGVTQVSGDRIPHFRWRFRGPRFSMEWAQASAAAVDRTHFTAMFDLSQPPATDDFVGTDELGFEIAFHWRGQWRSEIHRWPILRRDIGSKVLWDVAAQIIPPLEIDCGVEEGQTADCPPRSS